MDITTFLLERNQTLYENEVEINLTESGVHPHSLSHLLSEGDIAEVTSMPLGYGYTEGHPALRSAIARWYLGAGEANVAVTHGASEANLLALLAVVNPGNEVIFVVPNFMQLSGLGEAMGVRVTPFLLREEEGWQPRLDRLEAAIGPDTKMIALANPNNPTGIVLTVESMDGLAKIADRHGLYLLCDEIYRGAEIDLPETPSFFGRCEKPIVTMSLSKSFALPGLRLGWIVANEEVVGKVARWQDYSTIGTGTLNQAIATRILQPTMREQVLARGRQVLGRNIALLEGWIERHRAVFSWSRPQAGGMAFLRYHLSMGSEDFSARLRRNEGVFVVAGQWFGLDGHVRIGIGVEYELLAEGLSRIDRFARECAT